MDSKRPKQKMPNGETYEGPGSRRENKSKRPRTDDNEREAQEFFALVERIQALKELMNSIPGGNIGANVINAKSPWKPVLQWEDFSNMPPKCSPCTNKNAISCAVSREADMESGKHMGVEIFDLNEEPTSEQPVTTALNLFS